MSDTETGTQASTIEFTVGAAADAVAAVIGDRVFISQGEHHHTHAQLADRSKRLASYLHSRGLGVHTERAELADHDTGQDLLGIYAYNGNEYIEALLGSFRARVAPFNVNYRYVSDELRYLLADSAASALVYHAVFAPALAAVLPDLPQLRVLIQIDDNSGNDLLPGAVDYETVIAESSPEGPPVEPSPDDLYVLYTGGTTGMPKGVLWRQHDIFVAAFGGRNLATGELATSYDDIAARSADNPGIKIMVLPPLMHGAAQWAAMQALSTGQSLVFPTVVDHLDPPDIVAAIEREKAGVVMLVGDAVARPLLTALEDTTADVSSLFAVANGGAILSPTIKKRLIDALPNAIVIDGVGSSETGAQMTHLSTAEAVSTGRFTPGPGTSVLSEDLDHLLDAGHEGIGWLAQHGHVPLGYKGDAARTAKSFPTVAGIRYSLPGDRARLLPDGSIELLGRDSVTINSGGEKIFVEEVEMAIASHPAVSDVVVAGRPSERWGEEVVAVVSLIEGATADSDALVAHAGQSLARYKLPKAVLFRTAIQRSPVGKADYRWARQQAATSD